MGVAKHARGNVRASITLDKLLFCKRAMDKKPYGSWLSTLPSVPQRNFPPYFPHCSGGGVEATAKCYPLRSVSQDRNGAPGKCPVHHHTMRQSLDPTFIQNAPLQQASRVRGTRKQNIASWNGGVGTHIQNLPPARSRPAFCGSTA